MCPEKHTEEGEKVELIDIRLTIKNIKEVEKINFLKKYLKITKHTKLINFLINDKYQNIKAIEANYVKNR